MRRLDLGIYMTLGVILSTAGCQPYGATRAEVVGNGQGGVEVHRVANDSPPPQLTATARGSTTEDLESRIRQQQYEIESLQAALRARDEEIRRLKQSPATRP